MTKHQQLSCCCCCCSRRQSPFLLKVLCEGGMKTFSPRSVLLARVSDSLVKRVRQPRLPECSPKRNSLSLAAAGQRTSQCSRSWPSSPQRLHVGEVLGSIRFLYARRPT